MANMEFAVGGMHCPACVALLTEEFSAVPGVSRCSISLQSGVAAIEHEGEAPPLSAFAERAEKLGYTVAASGAHAAPGGRGAPGGPAKAEAGTGRGGRLLRAAADFALPAAIAGGVILAFTLVQGSPFVRALSRAGAIEEAGGAGIALLVGVAASFSSCLALVGSLVVAFGANYSVASAAKARASAFRANALFHAGRLAAFFLLGGLLGALGGAFSVSYLLVGIVGLIAAAAMLVSGLGLAGLGSVAGRLGLRAPRFAVEAARRLKESRNPAAPLALGAVTFFLPCGFTQGMQAFALASGSFVKGGLAMLFFGLGTLPVLFAAGMTAHLARKKGIAPLTKAAGLLLVVLAFAFGSNAFAQISTPGSIGVERPGPAGAAQSPATGPAAAPKAAEQVVEMHVLYSGFSPSVIKLKKGVPVLWKVYGDEITGCTNALVIPSLKVKAKLSRGVTEIRFTPSKSGELPYSCWMGMVWAKFVVED